jgi:restriction system protein
MPVVVWLVCVVVLHLSGSLPLLLALVSALVALSLGLAATTERSRRTKAVRAARSLDAIKNMPWQDFERLVAGVFAKQGWLAMPTASGADGGVDIILTKGEQRSFVQCKRWKMHTVKVDAIRALFGVMAAEHVAQGVFVTAGRFTSEAERFASDCGIECVDGEGLLAVLGITSPTPGPQSSPAISSHTDAPNCPRCHQTMVRRVGTWGAFWGCPRFPSCRGTRPL